MEAEALGLAVALLQAWAAMVWVLVLGGGLLAGCLVAVVIKGWDERWPGE